VLCCVPRYSCRNVAHYCVRAVILFARVVIPSYLVDTALSAVDDVVLVTPELDPPAGCGRTGRRLSAHGSASARSGTSSTVLCVHASAVYRLLRFASWRALASVIATQSHVCAIVGSRPIIARLSVTQTDRQQKGLQLNGGVHCVRTRRQYATGSFTADSPEPRPRSLRRPGPLQRGRSGRLHTLA